MPKSHHNQKGMTKVQLNAQEWEAVARELYRQHPIPQYLNSQDLSELVRQDFLDAQCVLPPERRRASSKIPSLQGVRKKLVPAMAKLRAELQAQPKPATPGPSFSKVVQIPQAQPETPRIPDLNPFEAVFGPLVEFLAEETARRTEQRLMVMLSKLNLIPDTVSEYTPEGRKNPKAIPKPRIGVVGLLGVQQMELRRAFPEVEFVMEESSSAVRAESFHTCDKIIGMTDFMRHGADGILREKFGEKYARTTGSTSSAKRLIGLVLHGLKPQAAKPNLSAHH